MKPTALRRHLKRIHQIPSPPDPKQAAALEADLGRRHRELYGDRCRVPGLRARRVLLALGAAALLLVTVGALPTEAPIVSGELLTFGGLDPSALPELAQLLRSARRATSRDEVSVSISESADGTARLVLLFLDRDPERDRATLLRRLESEVSAVAGRPHRWDELRGAVRMSLAERAGRRLFSIAWSPGQEAEARRQLLGGVARSGAGVELAERDGTRRIRIELPAASESR